MIKWLKEHLCIHKWEEMCSCGNQYRSFCMYLEQNHDCKRHYIGEPVTYCDYYYRKCKRCGKEEWKV